MIEELIEELKEDEGFRAQPYHDTLGYLTIGYGFLIDERKHLKMPRTVAEMWLTILVGQRVAELMKAWPPFIDQDEEVQKALGNMAYQLGIRGLLRFKRMLGALEDGDRLRARREALDSEWAKQTPNRAKRIADAIGGNHGS